MYKILINERPLYLLHKEEVSMISRADDLLMARYTGPKRHLYHYIDALEKGSKRYNAIALVVDDVERLKEECFSLFELQPAAGGLVFTPDDKILAIYRRGWWDLPKGKLDPGEAVDAAALREVIEETGVKAPVIDRFLSQTFHVFKNKRGVRILKQTDWFIMRCNEQKLVPQKEEDIEQAQWLSVSELLKKKPLYHNIQDLLELL